MTGAETTLIRRLHERCIEVFRTSTAEIKRTWGELLPFTWLKIALVYIASSFDWHVRAGRLDASVIIIGKLLCTPPDGAP